MVTFFSGKELLEIAIGIEKNGYSFYQSLADKTEDDAAKSLYAFLAREEKRHESIFRSMMAMGSRLELPESYPGEYQQYVKSLVDSLLFQNLKAVAEGAGKDRGMEALNVGIQAEKDSILFYNEMQPLVPQADRDVVGRIIHQEKGHLTKLHSLKESLVNQTAGR